MCNARSPQGVNSSGEFGEDGEKRNSMIEIKR